MLGGVIVFIFMILLNCIWIFILFFGIILIIEGGVVLSVVFSRLFLRLGVLLVVFWEAC